MRRRAFTVLAAATAGAGIFACVTSSSSPGGPPSFDGSFPDALGSSGGTDASADSPTAPEASADAADAADAGSTLRWVYVAGALEPNTLPDGGYNAGVYGFAADLATGALTAIDTDGVTPGFQSSVAADVPRFALATPDGRFLYATAFTKSAKTLYEFAIDRPTGALTPIGTLQIPSPEFFPEFAVDPGGKHLFIPDVSNGTIHVVDIAADGTLTEQPTTYPAPVAPSLTFLTMSPSGRFLFTCTTAGGNTGSLTSSFSVDPATGALAHLHDIPAATTSSTIVHHPTKQVIYVFSYNNSLVSALAYDATGTFTALSTKPNGAFNGAVDPTGSYLYATVVFTPVIDAFTLNPATGDLGAPIVSDGGLITGHGVTPDPSGRAVFADGLTGGGPQGNVTGPLLSVWTVGAGGTLTLVPSSAPGASESALSGPVVIVR